MYKSESFSDFAMCGTEFRCSHPEFLLFLNDSSEVISANQKVVQLSLQLEPKVVSLKYVLPKLQQVLIN